MQQWKVFWNVESTKKEYLKDLDLFYKTFTGNDKRPEKIKRFGDIPMNTYNQDTMCDVPYKR